MDARVLLADDYELYRNVLKLALETAGFVVVEEISTGRQAIEATLRQEPDILLLDIAMPDMDGFAALPVIKFLRPETRIVLHTSITNPEIKNRARELGADALIPKSVDMDQLIETLRSILTGFTRGVNPEFLLRTPGQEVPLHIAQNPSRIDPVLKQLTDQERQILSHLADGEDNNTICEGLFISQNTLKTHMRNIFNKLGVSNRTQAALWAIRNGLDEEQVKSQVA
jgi:two-component system NarL family response regulator